MKYLSVERCPNITEFEVDENNENFCSVDGVIYDKDFKRLMCYPPSKENKTFRIPDSIEGIGYEYVQHYDPLCPFESCQYLENIIFPESLKYICECAFYNCNFEYLEFTDNVVLKPYAFQDNKKLKEIIFPENFEVSLFNVFDGCDSIETIVFLSGWYG